jgi:transposase
MADRGRPSKYKPEYCEQLVKHMAEGYSFESFAAVINVNRDTLYEWASVHVEFSDAKKRAFEKNLKWMEDQAVNQMIQDTKGAQLNTTLWIFLMKARHGLRDGGEPKSAKDSNIKIDKDDEAL